MVYFHLFQTGHVVAPNRLGVLLILKKGRMLTGSDLMSLLQGTVLGAGYVFYLPFSFIRTTVIG